MKPVLEHRMLFGEPWRMESSKEMVRGRENKAGIDLAVRLNAC